MKTLKCAPVRQSQAGFTLIELIMVIVILGILSAVAAPKFLDLTGDAKKASAESIHGTIQSTMAVAFASHRAGGLSASGTGDDQYITSCDSLVHYLDGGLPGSVNCTGKVLSFDGVGTVAIENWENQTASGDPAVARASLSNTWTANTAISVVNNVVGQ